MFRYVTLSVILGSFFVASVNSQRPLQACQCQVSIYQRRGCLVPGLLTPAKCSEVGCCFDPNYYRIYLFASAPRCFAPQGDCSRANCQVERSRRQSCGNLYRFACERVGCCFSFDRYGSSCYRAASPVASTVAITTTTTRAPTTTTRGRPVVLIWSAWGQWSACSDMCTRGIRARTRQCTRGGPVASRVCPEQSVSQTCNDDLCRSWDSWKNVMPCSITCGGIGKAFTTRVCLDRGKIGPQICYLRENGCIRPACVPIPAVSLPTWSQWEQWGVCSSSCTPGNQYRGRRCRINSRDVGSVRCSPTDPQGQSLQKRPCNGNMCKLWGPWSRPVPCPTSCGETPVPSGSTRTCWFGAESPRTQAQQIIFDRCSIRSLECPELNCYVTARFAAATTPKGDFSTLEVTSSVQTTPPVETQSTTLAATTEMPTIATTATTATTEMPTIATTATTASTTTSATTTTTTEAPTTASTATVTLATSALIPKIATTATSTTTTETPTTASTEMSTTATTPTTTAAASSSSQEATIVFQIWNLWSACSQSCGPGIRSRLKICLDREGNNLTQDDEKCPEKSQNQGCNLDLCNEWTDWGPTECLGGCDGPAKKQAIGTRRMTRECAQLDKSKGALECYNKTRSCVRVCPSIDVTLSLPKSWGVWAQWGQCSSSCASGTRSRSRECPDTTCQGSSTEFGACNQNFCDEWSEWASAPCSASCGEGERISTRSCLDNRNNNVISSDEQCYRRVETCRQAECDVKTDDVIDFLFLVDSSNRVDDCPALETSGVAVPVTSQTMSNITTPNYLKIKEFMKDFTRDWKSFDQNKSRVAIQLISGPCKPKTDNNLNLVRTFADEPETLQSDIESFPYICGKFWLDWALRCTKSKVLTPSNGDRADVPTVVVALLAYQLPNSRPGKFLLSALSNDIVRTRNATILSLSATDPGSLSALGRSKHEEMLTTLSCGFFPSCPRFLGSIWDKNRGSPAQRIREALKA